MEYATTRYTQTLGELIENENFKLFDFEYTFPEEHKTEMENYVINWFYEDEIGAETPNAFKRLFIPKFFQNIALCAEMVNLFDENTDLLYNNKEEWRENVQTLEGFTKNTTQSGSTESGANNTLTEQDTPVNPIGANEQYASFKSATNSSGDSSTSNTANESNSRDEDITRYGERFTENRSFLENLETIRKNWQNPYGWLCHQLAPCFISLIL